MQLHHLKRHVVTSQMNDLFVIPYAVRSHMHIHTRQSIFSCEVCDDKFMQSGHLIARVHA